MPDTVQLIVDVAGLCSSAPAFETMRPAGIAPWRSAHRKRSYQSARSSPVASVAAIARATRCQVSSTSRSMTVPSRFFRRYFLSQMSREAACSGIPATSGPSAPA